MALVKLAVMLLAESHNNCRGRDAMKLSRNVPLRGTADTKRRVSAPPANQEVAVMRVFVPFALGWLLFSPVPVRAQSAHQVESMCHRIEKVLNTLVAYTHTSCLPTKGKVPGTYSFIVLSSKPVFSDQALDEAWVLMAVETVGFALNKNSAVKGDELWLSDADNMRNRIAYVMSLRIAKSLRRRSESNQITPTEEYSEIQKDLTANRFRRSEAIGCASPELYSKSK
jgi:hypothetical protein